MLRITVRRDLKAIAIVLEGKLAGDWVSELRTVCAAVDAHKEQMTVSLTDVSFIDTAGRQLLSEIYLSGAALTGSGLLAKALIEEITGFPS